MQEEKEKSSLFTINSNNKEFTARHQSIFEQLNVAELNRLNDQKNRNTNTPDVRSSTAADIKTQKALTNQFRGQKSIFKKPAVPLRKALAARRIPDHCVNPHKWTKYSLDDVKSEHTSERGNAAAAMAFLKEIESRKEKEEMDLEPADKKIVFQKSVIVQNKMDDDREEEKMRFRSSKVIMPEYVVGQKVKTEKKKTSAKPSSSGKELKLAHLMEDDDDGDDE